MQKTTIFAIIVLIISLSLTACDDGSNNPGGNDGNVSDFTYTEANGEITITKYNGSGESVTIPSKIDGKPVTTIGDRAFSYCRSLASITIPDSVTSIGNGAFGSCSSLASVTIPNSVTSIGEMAFFNCASLASVTIPDSVTSIRGWAFSFCSSLDSVTIPDSVTSIGYRAFASCTSLASVTCLAVKPPTMGADVFSSTQASLVIKVPSASVSAYKAAATNWHDYASRIGAMP
jgi:hypothetical protein